jgi:protocatechuate 3,4-dioxygenase beta subunit
VYLERLDRDTQGRLGELRRGLTDAQGGYRFPSLAPGTYRLVSSFDFDDPDGRTMESARPRTVVVREGEDITVELDLYAAP